MARMVAFVGLNCSIALAGTTCEQENALNMVQMMVQKQFVKMPEDDVESPAAESPWGAAETQTVEALAAEAPTVETLAAEAPAVAAVEEATKEEEEEEAAKHAETPAVEAVEAALDAIDGLKETVKDAVEDVIPFLGEGASKMTGEEEEEALQQQRTGVDLADDMSLADDTSLDTNASVISSAAHWGSPGTCKVTDDTFFSVFDGAKKDASLLEADIDTDTDTNTDSGFRLKDFLKDREAKDLWLVRGRAHDGSTVRIAARYWRNASATGHQIFLKSLAVSGGFITNRTLVVRPLQDVITWNNKKETYSILTDNKKESAFSIEGLVNATRKMSTSGSTVEVMLPKEVKLVFTMHQKYINVALSMPPLAIQDGLCGNFNGDSSDDTLGMILSRGPRVNDAHSLLPAEWVPAKATMSTGAQPYGEMFTESRDDVILDMD